MKNTGCSQKLKDKSLLIFVRQTVEDSGEALEKILETVENWIWICNRGPKVQDIIAMILSLSGKRTENTEILYFAM